MIGLWVREGERGFSMIFILCSQRHQSIHWYTTMSKHLDGVQTATFELLIFKTGLALKLITNSYFHLCQKHGKL